MNVQRLNNLLASGKGHTVLFRLPEESLCTIVQQTGGEPAVLPSVAELGGEEGYVMTPFAPSAEHPILLLHPDILEPFSLEELESTATFLQGNEGASAALDADAASTAAPNGSQQEGDSPQDESEERARYHLDFANFHAQIEAGQFNKLVLARMSERQYPDTAGSRLTPLQLFARACHLYPHQYIALISLQGAGEWLMATPELLLGSHDGCWHTMALAGTQRATAEQLADNTWKDARWSEKNKLEQRCVTTYITQILERHTQSLEVSAPYTTTAARLLHLRTDFTFRLHEQKQLGTLLDDLFPTPAVCGLPKEAARHFILRNENVDRRYYSGFCGMIRPHGDTALFVSLRCMQLLPHAFCLYAGGGLLADSEEESEWQETEAKIHTMARLIE